MPQPNTHLQPWKVLKTELVVDEKWYTLRRDEVE